MAQVRLHVTGMSCAHCVAAVENALKAISGVEDVTVDLESGEVLVGGSAVPEELIASIVEEGYEAQLTD